MKKVLSLVLILVLVLSAGAFAFQNEPDGFRGLKWGDTVKKGMILLGETKGEVKGYMVPDDELYLGDANFYSILYGFYDQPKRFMIVYLFFNGKENYGLLTIICHDKFGEETERGFYEYSWQSQKAMVKLTYDWIEEKGSLYLASFPIFFEHMQARKKKEAEKAAEDW